jgi:hypothetical protein
MDEVLKMSVPLDSDGFLRRECPTCDREFKWLPSGDSEEGGNEDAIEVDPGGYFCPYCGVQAPPGSWSTKAQIEAAKAMTLQHVLPELENLGRGIGRSGGGLIDISLTVPDAPVTPTLTEEDDMLRIDFSCHPSEPLKILESWDRPVRCLLCGGETVLG